MGKRNKLTIIDTHTHIGAIPGMIFTGRMVIQAMDEAGVDKTIGMRMISGGGGPFGASQKHNPYNGNDYIAEMQEKYPDRIIGFCMVDFFDQDISSIGWKSGTVDLVKENNATKELIRCVKDLNLKGLFMHPDFQGFTPNNFDFVGPVLDTLVSLQKEFRKKLPVLIHGVGSNIHYTVPEQIGDLARHYPDLLFIVPQIGWMLLAYSMITVAKKFKNIYLELMLNVNIISSIRAINEIGADRLTLGTDAPWGSYTLGQKMIEEIANTEDRELILGGTIEKILDIS